jgi:PIN domain nuclease of toxin-antitoxin system
MSAVLDTHTALWSVFDRKRISQAALQAIRRSVNAGKPLLVSAISLVETIYLVERGRIPREAFRRLDATLRDPASGLVVAPVDEDVAQAVFRIPRQTVPDMPDRIIAATALRHNLPLLTRDSRIQAAGIKTIW